MGNLGVHNMTDREAFLQFGEWGGPYQTVKVELRESEAPRNPYPSGYGRKIPTSYEIRYLGRWRRVYCTCYSNSGTPWATVEGKRIVVAIH